MTRNRRRECRYPALVSARITEDSMERIEAIADQELMAAGIIVRRALEAGLSVLEQDEDVSRKVRMEQARSWWNGLDARETAAWQKRVAPLKGREMIAEAWKRSQGL